MPPILLGLGYNGSNRAVGQMFRLFPSVYSKKTESLFRERELRYS
jgi:hypothetical protein